MQPKKVKSDFITINLIVKFWRLRNILKKHNWSAGQVGCFGVELKNHKYENLKDSKGFGFDLKWTDYLNWSKPILLV